MKLLLIIAAVLMAGCRRSVKVKEPSKTEHKPESTTEQVIDGITGRKAVNIYKNIKIDIKGIEAKQKQRLDKTEKF